MSWIELRKNLLDKIDILRKRKLKAIKVDNGTAKFWVRNPKKMKFWLGMAENSARGLSKDKELAAVKIVKEIFVERRKTP